MADEETEAESTTNPRCKFRGDKQQHGPDSMHLFLFLVLRATSGSAHGVIAGSGVTPDRLGDLYGMLRIEPKPDMCSLLPLHYCSCPWIECLSKALLLLPCPGVWLWVTNVFPWTGPRQEHSFTLFASKWNIIFGLSQLSAHLAFSFPSMHAAAWHISVG